MLIFIKELSWHSWCKVILYKENDRFFIRKTAWKKSYNERLKIQLDKQKSFQSKDFFAPKILRQGYLWEIFYFDMEYLNCKTLASHMQTISVKEISKLAELSINTLDIKWSKIIPNTDEIFKQKISSLKNSLINITESEEKAFQMLENFDFSLVPQSKCHWDLTLENVLITPDKNIYLIDFLDSFFDSRMIDVAKILQDLETLRSYRHQKIDTTLSLRLSIAKQALIENIIELPDWKDKIKHIYYILLLNILRIVPYSKDTLTKNFLQNALKHVMNILINNKF